VKETAQLKKKIDQFCTRLTKLLPFVKITQVVENGKITTIKIEGTILTKELK